MSRLVFVGPHAPLAAAVAGAAYAGPAPDGAVAELIEELDEPLRVEGPIAGDDVVDTRDWDLPTPVGMCLEEVRELRAVIEDRVSRLR
ncbi:MAG TPA: hypothetical protein VKR23_00780 [Gaiellaceae bacterium]|nr:hypothetical protein [Gaiellaceae bacterium]